MMANPLAPAGGHGPEKAGQRRRASRILIVEDNDDNRMLMRELLLSRGYEVVCAEDADAAERAIAQKFPDLVLLDVVMPGRSGYELCHKLKADPQTRLIPVVIITGLSDRQDRVQGIEAGADEFLSKPIYPEELFARVTSLLKLKDFTDELENVEAVLFTLALSVEARDPYTEGHCDRLASYASSLGQYLGLPEHDIVALRRGGVLHDLGKIVIPDAVLKKGSNLTADEWRLMRQHPLTGEAICKPLKSLRHVLPIIRNHHEHWDGSGYPDGLRGEEIPLLARMIQVADVYDALRTTRPYKPALSHAEAYSTMLAEADRGLWDKQLVQEFFAMLQAKRRAA
ncbi:MAG TPA: HD domain-containing phosphohydrolase [Terriglobales bacterium]|nr:HD domain-containing phosphohydrolase [Terriglobales bacterium]